MTQESITYQLNKALRETRLERDRLQATLNERNNEVEQLNEDSINATWHAAGLEQQLVDLRTSYAELFQAYNDLRAHREANNAVIIDS